MMSSHTDARGQYPRLPFEVAVGILVSPKRITQADSRILAQPGFVCYRSPWTLNDHKFPNLRFSLQ